MRDHPPAASEGVWQVMSQPTRRRGRLRSGGARWLYARCERDAVMMLKVCWLTSFSSISKALGTRNHDDEKSPFEKGRDKIHPSKRAVMTTIALRKEPGGAEDNDDEGLLVDVVLLDLEGPGNLAAASRREVGTAG